MSLIPSQPSPGQVAQFVRTLSRYTKVVGLIPGQVIYKNQPMSRYNKWEQQMMFLSLSLIQGNHAETGGPERFAYGW